MKTKSYVPYVLSKRSIFMPRPHVIVENFKMLDDKLDINRVFSKKYKEKTESLCQLIDFIIDIRNHIAHEE